MKGLMMAQMGSTVIRLLRTGLGVGFFAALVFLGAWRLDWPRGWLYAAVFVGASLIGTLIVQLTNPGVLAARAKGLGKGTKPFDKVFYRLFAPLSLLYPLLAGLDGGRFAWAPLPDWMLYLGVAIFLFSSVVTTWTLMANTHAELSVRIQEDRGHKVISDGPYRYVRHPMYSGTIIGFPATALILGSGWALLPAALLVVLFVWRTGREDATLQQELAGYADYAAKTRYRLLPGVW